MEERLLTLVSWVSGFEWPGRVLGVGSGRVPQEGTSCRRSLMSKEKKTVEKAAQFT